MQGIRSCSMGFSIANSTVIIQVLMKIIFLSTTSCFTWIETYRNIKTKIQKTIILIESFWSRPIEKVSNISFNFGYLFIFYGNVVRCKFQIESNGAYYKIRRIRLESSIHRKLQLECILCGSLFSIESLNIFNNFIFPLYDYFI